MRLALQNGPHVVRRTVEASLYFFVFAKRDKVLIHRVYPHGVVWELQPHDIGRAQEKVVDDVGLQHTHLVCFFVFRVDHDLEAYIRVLDESGYKLTHVAVLTNHTCGMTKRVRVLGPHNLNFVFGMIDKIPHVAKKVFGVVVVLGERKVIYIVVDLIDAPTKTVVIPNTTPNTRLLLG